MEARGSCTRSGPSDPIQSCRGHGDNQGGSRCAQVTSEMDYDALGSYGGLRRAPNCDQSQWLLFTTETSSTTSKQQSTNINSYATWTIRIVFWSWSHAPTTFGSKSWVRFVLLALPIRPNDASNNAVALFPDLVGEHARHAGNIGCVEPKEVFQILGFWSQGGCFALLAYGVPRVRQMLVEGNTRYSGVKALERLP